MKIAEISMFSHVLYSIIHENLMSCNLDKPPRPLMLWRNLICTFKLATNKAASYFLLGKPLFEILPFIKVGDSAVLLKANGF